MSLSAFSGEVPGRSNGAVSFSRGGSFVLCFLLFFFTGCGGFLEEGQLYSFRVRSTEGSLTS